MFPNGQVQVPVQQPAAQPMQQPMQQPVQYQAQQQPFVQQPAMTQVPQYAPNQMFGTGAPNGGPTVLTPIVPSAVGQTPVGAPQGSPIGGQSTPAPTPPVPETAELIRAIAELRNSHQQSLAQQQQAIAALRQQQAPVQQPAQSPSVDPNGIPQVPQFDQSLMRFITTDANGGLVEAPGAPPGTLAAYHAHQSALRNFITNAPNLLQQQQQRIAQLQQHVQNISQATAEQQRSAAIQQALSEVEPWAVEKDVQGRPIEQMDYATGQSVIKLTARGQTYRAALEEAGSLGIVDPTARHRYAMNSVDAKMPMRQAPARPGSVPSPMASASIQGYGGQPAVGPMSAMMGGGVPGYQTVAQQYPAQPAPVYGQPSIGPVDLNSLPRSPIAGPRPRLVDMMRAQAAQMGIAI